MPMAKQPQQQPQDSARDLQAAGVPQEHHDEVRALHPLALARGVDWVTLLAIVRQHGPDALAIIRQVLEAVRPQQRPEGQERVREGGPPTTGEGMHPAIEHVLKFFGFGHLPAPLQEISRPFADLAKQVAERAPDNQETTVALRKLLEAKDAAVRAMLK
jgi:hypothetical protein